MNSTIYYKAYFKEGSGLYGPKQELVIDGSSNILTVNFRQVSFTIVDAVTLEIVNGAQVYLDHIGYVDNGGTAIVPLGSTIYHKAKVDGTWSEKTGKVVEETWSVCVYQWDGVGFSSVSYE